MKLKFTLLMIIGLALKLSAQTGTFYDYSWPSITGDTIHMSQYAGKKIMVVNVASFCAYTPEFAPLSQLDSIYSSRYNFAIIGFPCDEFGHQKGTDSQVVATCSHYSVNFQIMSTVTTKGVDTTPVYKWLERAYLNGVADKPVTWNFNKFLIDRQGHWVKWYDSPTSPLDQAITDWIVEDSASLTGMADVQTSGISMRPNPAHDHITLSSPDPVSVVTVSDLVGRIVYTGTYHDQQVHIDISGLSSGVYLLGADDRSFRFIKD